MKKQKTVDGYRIPMRGHQVGTWLMWACFGVVCTALAALGLFVLVRLGIIVFGFG